MINIGIVGAGPSGLACARALPRRGLEVAILVQPERSVRPGDLYVTGDGRRNGPIYGALVSGRHAAEAAPTDLEA
ncbi:NAD(P)-binding protein [Rubrivirga sp. IMCC45206]|uniref:NAD(P)-binding protein n=1 Tax=Rubrivirga sp. IMCC45206 TaxID=3391614 RepID=UPI00398FA34E